jgi:hypothetical protein
MLMIIVMHSRDWQRLARQKQISVLGERAFEGGGGGGGESPTQDNQ